MFKLFKVFSLVLISLIFFSNLSFADELDDIFAKISKANADLQTKSDALKSTQSQISDFQNQSQSISQNIDKLTASINDFQSKIDQTSQELQDAQNQLNQVTDFVNQKEHLRDDLVKQIAVIQHRNSLNNLLNSGGIADFYNQQAVYSSNLIREKEEMDKLNIQIAKLSELQSSNQKIKKELEDQVAQINAQKSNFESQRNSISNNLSHTQASASYLKSDISSLKRDIGFLTVQQQQIEEKQAFRLDQGGSSGVVPLKDGTYYFLGKGRTKYDGHGVGMSQMGSYGMAKNAHFNAQQILKFYYTGVSISTNQISRKIVVDGVTGPISFDDYLSGIGEVPSTPCESVGYSSDIWACWPQEAVKSQIIAARTYALKNSSIGGDGYYHICGTDSCQVYVGGQNKRWAVDATKNLVITYNGQLISALYSAFHVGHSEDNEKVFDGGIVNGGTPYPYLRGVDDSAYAQKPVYSCPGSFIDGICKWRTNGYTLDELSSILASDSSTNVGKLSSIGIVRGSSERVWKVTLTGSADTKTVTGLVFQSIYNNWVYYNKPSGERDYLYSSMFSYLNYHG